MASCLVNYARATESGTGPGLFVGGGAPLRNEETDW